MRVAIDFRGRIWVLKRSRTTRSYGIIVTITLSIPRVWEFGKRDMFTVIFLVPETRRARIENPSRKYFRNARGGNRIVWRAAIDFYWPRVHRRLVTRRMESAGVETAFARKNNMSHAVPGRDRYVSTYIRRLQMSQRDDYTTFSRLQILVK